MQLFQEAAIEGKQAVGDMQLP